MAALEENFDVVVIATGLPEDRRLTVPVDPHARVLGAGQLLRLLNGDPDSTLRAEPAPLGADVVVIGAGNVAMDVARLLCKGDDGFHGSDVDDEARDMLAPSNLRRLTLLSRSPRDRLRWDPAMLAELRALPNVSVTFDGAGADGPPQTTDAAPHDRTVHVGIHFNEAPVAIDVDGDHTIVHTRPTTGPETGDVQSRHDESSYRVDTVITAMGFVDSPSSDLAAVAGDRVLRVGGCGSGTLGNLAENRALARDAAGEIVDLLRRDHGRPGLTGIRGLCPAATSFDDWTCIDRAEIGRARPNRLRTKFTSWSAMSAVIAEHRRTATGHPGHGPASDQ
jgi:ferredoxin--NADP+ reductase